jgi:hypothetical protein
MVTLHPWRLATRAVDSRTRAQEWSMEGQVRGSGGRSGAWREWSQFRAAVPPIPSPGELCDARTSRPDLQVKVHFMLLTLAL